MTIAALVHGTPDRHHPHHVGADHTPTRDHRREHLHDEEVHQQEAHLDAAEDHRAIAATAAEVAVRHGADPSVRIDVVGGGEQNVSHE